jgi:hypothetical protein
LFPHASHHKAVAREQRISVARWNRDNKKRNRVMRTAKLYRQYAEDCRRIARNMPAEQRAKLLEIADAWMACADNLEKRESADEEDDGGAMDRGMLRSALGFVAQGELGLRSAPP